MADNYEKDGAYTSP